MSDLEDALDDLEHYSPGSVKAIILDAARKCAYPDYEAAAVLQHNRNMYELMWVVWADLSEGDRVNRIKQARVDVDAALGVTEDTLNELRPPGSIRELSEILDDIEEDE